MSIFVRLTLISAVLLPSAVFSFTATSYEPMHCTVPMPHLADGTTSVSLFGTSTEGSLAYNGTENSAAFLEQYGTIAAKDLITGLATPSTDSVAYKYLHADGANSIATKDATLRFNDEDNKYSFSSTSLTLTQHLFTGLFVQIHAQLVEQSLTQKPTATGPDANDADVAAFLTDFDTILAEYDLPPLTYHNRATSLERFAILAGWSGRTLLRNSLFEEISGSLSGGYISTPPSFNHPLAPAALPYNISDGFVMRGTAHAQIMRHLGAYIDASSTVYNQRNGTMHVVTDDAEGDTWYAGPLLLGTGFVKKNPGTLWTLNAGLVANRIKGFSLGLGYQFSYQETTDLEVKDETLLRGADWTGTKLHLLPALQKSRLNSDPRLLKWKHHAFTLRLAYEPAHQRSRVLPHFEVCLFLPTLGHRTGNPSTVLSGGGRVSVQWKL